MNATQIVEDIKTKAQETSRSRLDTDTKDRNCENLQPCDQFFQGDVRVIVLPEETVMKRMDQLEEIKDFDGQVAPGTTMGSRHVLSHPERCKAYRIKGGNAVDGPIVYLPEPDTLTHPEHGHCQDLPCGWLAFPGQQVYADELRRVAD